LGIIPEASFEKKVRLGYNLSPMILRYLRKKTKAILIGTLILIIPAFIFLYGWSRLSPTTQRIPYIIAKVDRVPITFGEYQTELTQYKNILGGSYSTEDEKQIERQVLDGLIEKELLIREAKLRDIQVNDDEVITRIQEIFRDEKGNFDKEKFLLISEQYPEEVNALEENLRTEIMINKLKNIITNSVEVSEDEAYKYFLTSDAKAKIKYIPIESGNRSKDMEVSEEELKNYYEQNRESFKDGPWRKIEYVVISKDKIKEGKIKIDPAELEEYYSQHLQEWTKGDTEVSPFSEVKDEIEAKLEEREKEEILKDKAFDISLKLLDEDDWSSFAKNEGLSYGVTGYFAKDEPIPEFNKERATIINQAAFSLPFNEVSEPLKVERGYTIIRPLDKIPEYKEVADKIKNIIIEEKKKNLAEKTAEEILSELKKGEKIEDVSKKYSIEVKESEYFPRYGFIKNIGYAPKITQAAFSLDKDQWSKVVTASGKIFIIQTVDVKEPTKEEFQESKERITSILLYQKKQEAFIKWLKELKRKNKDKIVILWDELLPYR
jgi:peptidyl-prolyl cis-trans isomerase D